MNKDSVAAQTFDVTAKEREIIEWRYKRRLELRHQYLKEVHKPNSTVDGYVFDPQIQRQYTAYFSYDRIWKPKIKNFLWFSGLIFGSWAALTIYLKHHRDEKELKFRTGLVSYRDREAKFV